MQVGSHQLTIFPGSFSLAAVIDIFSHNSSTDYSYYFAQSSYELTSFLVRSSLLEYNQRTKRYWYHILIKEYFLLLQRKEKSQNTTKYMPAFYIHYAKQLALASSMFPHNPDGSLALLDLEHHNIQHLLDQMITMRSKSKNSMHTEEFLETSFALSAAIDVGLLKLRFSRKILCKLVKHSITHFDKIMHHLEYYLQLSKWSFTQKQALHVYLLLINQQATCEQELDGAKRAVQVYTHRKHIIESKKGLIEFNDYINFFVKLSNYFYQLGLDTEVAECHRVIIQRTESDLASCEPNQCNYYDIGQAYYTMSRYEDAARFFEMSFETSNHTMNKAAALVRLMQSYNMLGDYDRENETTAMLYELYSDDINALTDSDFNIDGEAVQAVIIDLFRKAGFNEEANQLEIKFIDTINIKEIKLGEHKHKTDNNSRGYSLLARGVKILRYLDKQNNFTKIIDIGTFLRSKFQGSHPVLIMEVSLLIGRAKYYTISYSHGMKEMELALQTILNKPENYTENQKSTACYYLIPRVVYIEACYHLSVVFQDIVHFIIFGSAYLIFSPFPLSLDEPEDNESNQSVSEDSAVLSHTTELATVGDPLSVILNPLWSHYYKELTNSATDSAQIVYHSFVSIFFDPLARLIRMLNPVMCVVTIWAKLMLCYKLRFRSLRKNLSENLVLTFSSIIELLMCIRITYYYLKLTKSLRIIRPVVRNMRDPRCKYGNDHSIYAIFIDSNHL